MSGPVLLNLLNEVRNRYEMRGLSGILSLFRNEFNYLREHVTLLTVYTDGL